MADGRKSTVLARLPKTLLNAVRRGFGRFTPAVVAIVLYAIVVNAIVAEELDLGSLSTARVLAALYAAGVGSVVVRLFLESGSAGHVALGAIPPVAALALGILLWFAGPVLILAPSVISALLVLVPLAPFIGRGTPKRFWDFTLWTILGAALALFAVGLFALGLFALVALLDVLFGINIPGRIYTHAALTAVFLVGPLIALGRIPLLDRDDDLLDGRLIGFVKPVFQFVAAPFALVIASVLHLYAVRALVSGGPGNGEIGWITAFFLILVYALRLGIEPYLGQGSRLLDFVAKRFAWICAVPLGLLAIAAAERIHAHGVTLPRYYLAALCITMLVAIALQTLRRTREDIRWLAGVGPLALVASAFGPWGAAATVTRSQVERIATEQAELSGRAPSLNERSRLRSRLVAIDDLGALGAVAPQLPAEAENVRQQLETGADVATETVFSTLQPREEPIPVAGPRSFNFEVLAALALEGYDLAETEVRATAMADVDTGFRQLRFEGMRLILRPGVGVDLAMFARSLAARSDNLDAPILDLVADGDRPVRLRVEAISLDEAGRPINGLFTVLVRRADFPEGLFGSR